MSTLDHVFKETPQTSPPRPSEGKRADIRQVNCQTWCQGWKMPVRQFLHDEIANSRAFDTRAALTLAENRALNQIRFHTKEHVGQTSSQV
jgi:hypothetical protein